MCIKLSIFYISFFYRNIYIYISFSHYHYFILMKIMSIIPPPSFFFGDSSPFPLLLSLSPHLSILQFINLTSSL